MSIKTRNTKQKQILTQVIENAGRPLNINEILEEGQKLIPNLGVATVYREISRLSASNEITTVSIAGDAPRYELSKHHHHHFKCNECDKVYEMEGCSNDLKKLVPKGFKPLNHDLTFYGICKACA